MVRYDEHAESALVRAVSRIHAFVYSLLAEMSIMAAPVHVPKPRKAAEVAQVKIKRLKLVKIT